MFSRSIASPTGRSGDAAPFGAGLRPAAARARRRRQPSAPRSAAWRLGACVLVALASVGVAPAAAQIDYRNLDDDRPTLTEDAYPIERYAWELMLPFHAEREADGRRDYTFLAELTHSPARNLHLGIKAPLAVVDPALGPTSSLALAGVRPYALYNFNTESRWLPALSIRTDVALPWGALGGDATRLLLKGIATKSWGLTRVHVNVSRAFFDEGQALAAAEPASRWWVSAAVDRTLFRQSALLLAEVFARRDLADEPTEWVATVGTRYQWTPTLVFDAGVSRRLGAEGPDIGLNVGLTYAFALRGLMPGRPR